MKIVEYFCDVCGNHTANTTDVILPRPYSKTSWENDYHDKTTTYCLCGGCAKYIKDAVETMHKERSKFNGTT